VRLWPNPSPDQTLRQAQRLLANDPGLLRRFLDPLLFEGRIPIPLVHELHDELMKYDLMEKLLVWVVEQNEHPHLVGIYGTRLRAMAGAASHMLGIARRRGLVIADEADDVIDQGYADMNPERPNEQAAEAAFGLAIEMLEDELFMNCRIRERLIE
jgi:hypothetical protein